jgi:hypothetical protein
MPAALYVMQTGQNTGHCDCCGTATRRVWGFVSCEGVTVAAYFVGWTIGRPDHGAAFDLIFGAWGDGAKPETRAAIALDFRVVDGTPQYMVVDAEGRPPASSDLVANALARVDVIGSPLAAQVFEIVDAVYLGDATLDELRRWT